jgi:hypothetical protein
MSIGRGGHDTDLGVARPVARQYLPEKMLKAKDSGDRLQADEVLVEANLWLAKYPNDPPVVHARDQLREAYPIAAKDLEEGGRA